MKLSFNTIALSNIKSRKKQYLMLFIGIVLSIFFTATALLFGYSTYASLEELNSTRLGDQDLIVNNVKNVSFDELQKVGIFSEFGYSKTLVTVLPTGKIDDGGFNICVFDDTAFDLSGRRLVDGKFPQKEGEIALEQSSIAQLADDIDIGDTVKLTVIAPGLENSDGTQQTIEKKYTLVGILKEQSVFQDFYSDNTFDFNRMPSGIFSPKEQAEPGSAPTVKCYGKMTLNEENKNAVEKFLDDNHVSGKGVERTSYYNANFYLDNANDKIAELMTFCIVIAIVLVLASCLGIANSFSSILDDKKRQIGLLRAVGATRKQIRSIFGRESAIIALVSMPLALILACLTAFAVTGLLGENFVFDLNILVLVLVAVFGFLVVALACMLPLRRASAIPPMQAVRKADLSRKLKNKNIKSRDVYNVARLIANRNITLYKGKMLGISSMLVIAVAFFFIANSSITPAIIGLNDDHFTSNGEYSVTVGAEGIDTRVMFQSYPGLIEQSFHTPKITEQDKRDAENLKGVAKVFGTKSLTVKILIDRISPYLTEDGEYFSFSDLSPTLPKAFQDPNEPETVDSPNPGYKLYLDNKEQYEYDKDYLAVKMTGMDEDIFKELEPFVIDGSIDVEKLNSGEEVLLIAPKEYAFSIETIYEGGMSPEWKISDFTSEDNVITNDIFFVGDDIDLSLLYTDSDIEDTFDGDGNLLLERQEDAVRIDKTAKIGAILTTEIHDGVNIKTLHKTGGLFMPAIGDLITSNRGLGSLGFDTSYSDLLIHTDHKPDAGDQEYLEIELTEIASRTPDTMMLSYISAAQENRETYFRIFFAVLAILILLFVICVSMLNNALSSRIRSAKREIGTLRAVGASKADVRKSYFWQLLSMFAIGSVFGILIGIAVRFITINIMNVDIDGVDVYPFPIWQSLLFIIFMFGICCININNKVNGILKRNVVENIREL